MKISENLQEFLRTGPVQLDIENNNFVDVYRKAEEYFEFGSEKKHVSELTVLFYEAGIDPLDYMHRIPARFFYDTNIRSFKIPQHIIDMGIEAFANCSNLESVTIPDSFISINYYAFIYCTSLTSITIPDSVTSIGNHAFQGCSSLTSVTIPDSVTDIGRSTFYGCSSLESVIISNSVKAIGYHAFCGCAGLKEITYKGTVEEWKKVKKKNAFNFYIITHCIDGDLQLQRRGWLEL